MRYESIDWRPVSGFEFLQVSESGDVREFFQFKKHDFFVIPVTSIKKRGNYLKVRYDGQYYSIARMVALAFVLNPEDKPFVNHLNGNKEDNRAVNLEWATNQENTYHSIYTLGYVTTWGKRPVNVFKNGALVFSSSTTREAARYAQGIHSQVRACCIGKRKEYNGFTFQFA